MSKKKEQKNKYAVASQTGKAIKKYGGYVVTTGFGVLISKVAPAVIKKIKG